MRTPLACVAATMVAAASFPALPDQHDHRGHDAHVHGAAGMNLALEGSELTVEVVTPAANIVGFEHPPRDESEVESVKQAAASLEEGADWMLPSREAGCVLNSAEVTTGLLEEHDGHEHADHAHEEESEEGHAEFHVHYIFHCDNPEELDTIRVKLFEGFPGLEKIELQAITGARQMGATLTPGQPDIRIGE